MAGMIPTMNSPALSVRAPIHPVERGLQLAGSQVGMRLERCEKNQISSPTHLIARRRAQRGELTSPP